MFFTREKKIREGNLKLYRNVLEQAESFRFLGVHFDTRLTWRENIKYEVDIICHGVSIRISVEG